MSHVSAVNAQSGRYSVLLTHGTFHSLGLQLANVSVVLAFICAQQGLYWAAGLLFPAYSIGVVIGNSLSPYVLQRVRARKNLVIVCATGVMVAVLVTSGLSAYTRFAVAAVFLTASLTMGVITGIQKVAYSEIISTKLESPRRGDLILTQGAFGAIAAIITALLLMPFLTQRDPQHSQIVVLWLGAGALAAAAITAVFIGPVAVGPQQRAAMTFRDTYRQGMEAARSQPWFRRYAAIQFLFVPVSLGTSFYSMHASVNHGSSAGSLRVLVISSSIGLIVGSLFWRLVNRRLGPQAMLVISGLMGSMAAAICVVIEYKQEWDHVWIYGIVFIFATIANQAIYTAMLSWMSAFAPEQHRATLIGFSALLVALNSSALGAVLGAVAQDAAIVIPIVVILVLNLLAAGVAYRVVPNREAVTANDRSPG